MGNLESELTSLLNRYGADNDSITPDYILAQFLLGCLASFNTAVKQRETWHGRDARQQEPGVIPMVVVHDDAKCPKEPHTHSWNVPLSDRNP
jgi:hypothetical protein